MLRAFSLRIITLGILIAATLAMPRFALAAECTFDSDQYNVKKFACYTGISTSVGSTNLPSVIGMVIKMLLLLTGIIFFLFFFWAGVKWMTARGNAEIVEDSQRVMENLGLGLAVILISYAFTTFVMNQFFK